MMTDPMDMLPVMIAIAIIGAVWWHALGAKKAARRAARKACRQADVRFIDELALKGLRPGRDSRGRWCVRRIYAFEFYWSGNMRHVGRVVMHGQRVAHLQMEPYPLDGSMDGES